MTDLSQPPMTVLHLQETLCAIAVPTALCQGREVVAANDAMCRLTGRSLEGLQRHSYLDLLNEDDREPVERASKVCLVDGGTPPALTVRLRAPDGCERTVELHLRPLPHAETRVVAMTCIDQTDILHVQSSLMSLSDMLRQIVDGAPIAKFVIDRHHRVTHWNVACERMTGLARGEIIGSSEHWRAFYDRKRPVLADLIVDGFDLAQLATLYGGQATPSATIPGGIEAETFFPRFGSDGAWLYFTAAPLRDASGQVIGAIETLQDVTERRRAQDELRQHRDELELQVQQRTAELSAAAQALELFITNAPMGVSYSSAGVIGKVNRAMAEMFRSTPEAMCGSSVKDFHVSRESFEELKARVEAALSHDQPLHHEMWMRRVDGQAIWVQIDAHSAHAGDAMQGIWWMMQDRTEIRVAQQQLQARYEELQLINSKLAEAQNQLLQQDKMASIGQLAAGVAHEINNPIGFVSSNLNTLRQYVDGLMTLPAAYDAVLQAPEDAQARLELARRREEVELEYLRDDLPQLLDECAEGLGRVKKIVQDLKDFSRVDEADWQEADLNAGLESTLNVVRHEVKYKADVVKRLAPLPPVMCLAGQLNQVFMNLIVNAVHAIAERGTITLSSGVQDSWAWVQVTDTGCGMTEEVRRRIFEPFFTTKDVGKGTGLGLSLSFSIVQKHGGVIAVHSTPAAGSSFRVWVPVGGPQSLPAGGAPPSWSDELES
jgi:PAS domain S-box-containing protein